MLPGGGLQIARAAREDAGVYMCVAQNPAGTAVGKVKLNVQGTKSFPSGSSNMSAPGKAWYSDM